MSEEWAQIEYQKGPIRGVIRGKEGKRPTKKKLDDLFRGRLEPGMDTEESPDTTFFPMG